IPSSSAASAIASIGSCQPAKRRRISALRPPGSSDSPSAAFLVANQYVRPRPMSTSPNRAPTPHDSVSHPGPIARGETPRHAAYPAWRGGVPGGAGGPTGDQTADDRVEAVGADEQLGSLPAAARASRDHHVASLLNCSDLETDAHFSGCVRERSLKVSSVHGQGTVEQV